MHKEQYKYLMEYLEAAINNGFKEEIMEMSPEYIFREILDLTGTREFEDISNDEIHNAIQGWQERQDEM